MRLPRLWVAVCLVYLTAGMAAALVWFQGRPKPMPDFRMIDQNGRTIRLFDFRGKWVVVFFGDTHCTDACPRALSTLARDYRSMGQAARDVQVLFLTLDPARDSSRVLKAYVPDFHPSFLGACVDSPALSDVASGFHVEFAKMPSLGGRDYEIDHAATFRIVDPHGVLVPGIFAVVQGSLEDSLRRAGHQSR